MIKKIIILLLINTTLIIKPSTLNSQTTNTTADIPLILFKPNNNPFKEYERKNNKGTVTTQIRKKSYPCEKPLILFPNDNNNVAFIETSHHEGIVTVSGSIIIGHAAMQVLTELQNKEVNQELIQKLRDTIQTIKKQKNESIFVRLHSGPSLQLYKRKAPQETTIYDIQRVETAPSVAIIRTKNWHGYVTVEGAQVSEIDEIALKVCNCLNNKSSSSSI